VIDASVHSTRRALLLGGAALGLAGLESLFPGWARAKNSLRVGQPAPAAILVTLDGEHIATPDLTGRVVILTFWATWCGPCRQELPLLSTYAAQHADAGLTVLGFSLDAPEDVSKVRAAARSLHFPVGLLANASLPGYGRIWRIPVNFTIDRRGRLIDDGWKDTQTAWTSESLESIVTPLLAR
jgi:cytochrome c biogenesis protein CcmG, thiol:disulfide interchange protein DsbE